MIEGDIPPGSYLFNVNHRRLYKSVGVKLQSLKNLFCFAFVVAPGNHRYLGDVMIMYVTFYDGTYSLVEEKTQRLRQQWAFLYET